jgi:hypothetical protein
MALALGVKIGDVVDIAAYWIAVLSVDSRSRATLVRNDGTKIPITSKGLTEVAPDVWIGLGPDAATMKLRLLFEAPRDPSIRRRSGRQVRS